MLRITSARAPEKVAIGSKSGEDPVTRDAPAMLQWVAGAPKPPAALLARKALRFLAGLSLGLITGLALLVAASLLPRTFGYTPLVVLSGSMEPTLQVGDVAVTREIEPYALQVGDVVTYESISGYITHRIVGLDMTPQGPFFHMKGDANLGADPQPIPADRIVAKVVYRVPRVGFIVAFTDSAAGKFLLIVVPLVLLMLMWTRGRLARPAPPPDLQAAVGALTPHGRAKTRRSAP